MAKIVENPKGFKVIEAPTLYDISGSANFNNKADYGITVHRNRLENYVEVHVQKVKFKHLGECGECHFKYNINNGRYVPFYGSGFDNNNIAWDNTNHLQKQLQERYEEAERNSVLEFGNPNFDDECPF